MDYNGEVLLPVQLEGLEPLAPSYEYDGLELPVDLTVNGLFASHEDIGALGPNEIEEQRQFMQSHDIVVAEASGLTPHHKKVIQKIIKGDYKELQKFLEYNQISRSSNGEKNWSRVCLRAMYNIGRPVLIIDPPHGHPSYRGVNNWSGDLTPAGLDFATAINTMREKKLAYAEANLERENYMLSSFVNQTSQLLSENPRLKKKVDNGDKVSVCLWAFGTTHAGVYDGIKRVVSNSNHNVAGIAELYKGEDSSLNYHVQIVGRYIRGLELDDTLIAKNVVFGLLYSKEEQYETETIPQFETRIMQGIDNLSLEELGALYEDLSK